MQVGALEVAVLTLVSLLFACSPTPARVVRSSSAEPFPLDALTRFCPRRPMPPVRASEAWYDTTVLRLDQLDEDALIKRVCTTGDRQEVAIGATLLALRLGDDAALRQIADTWAEPLALAAWSSRRSSVHHDPYAYRASLAAALIADGIERRTGTPPVSILRHLPDPSFATVLDDADRSWVEAQRSRYLALFLAEGRSTRIAARN